MKKGVRMPKKAGVKKVDRLTKGLVVAAMVCSIVSLIFALIVVLTRL